MSRDYGSAGRPLTSRQERLYEVLKMLRGNGVGYVDVVDLAVLVNNSEPDSYEVCTDRSRNWHNPCPSISKDVEEINESPRKDGIIIVKDNAYKLAESEEEAVDYIRFLESKRDYYSHRLSLIQDKVSRNGQGKTVNNADRELKPENDQFFHAYK